MYDPHLIFQTCYHRDTLVALPVTLQYSVLYSNKDLLDKYNKTIPKTWDELLKTSKFILNEEKKFNKDLIGYNGYFPDTEDGLFSLYEFIYSYRNSKNSLFPELTSKESIEALKMVKTIKEEISSDLAFHSDGYYSINKLADGNSIFIKFWIFPDPYVNKAYKMTNLPGKKEGISASIASGSNISIFGNLPEDRKNATIIAYKFLTSKELQEKYTSQHILMSGIPSIYKNDNKCFLDLCNILIF
ncbi:hypothetical protein PIROE2DRAFT_58379 [Piromyces sp. E2]|nr:hypothetical protein PIROE2DRAFT_58379 [Piromyces sp. E2]|eukprot:OUM67981.1 hypothetical protein PIROE2DRAFT_58379 [Piromyces sp. E2]